MNRSPISRQRSSWVESEALTILGRAVRSFRRRVNDGVLVAIVGDEPTGWHLSISFRDQRELLTRYPRWDEIADARDALLPGDIGFVMHLPPADEYVALHDTTFHLHEHPERAT